MNRDPKNSNATWLDYLHSGTAGIRAAEDGLRDLAERLASVGMDKLARECVYLIKVLDHAHTEVQEGLNLSLTEQIHNTSAHSANIFAAVFAGTALATPPGPEQDALKSMALAVHVPLMDEQETAPPKPYPSFHPGDE